MSKPVALFCRVMPSELKFMDDRAKFAMRTRNNLAVHMLTQVVAGDKPGPSAFPDAAPGNESVVLFLRVTPELKHACAAKASEAGVPLSRWVRGVLTSGS